MKAYEKVRESQIEATPQNKKYLNKCYTKNPSVVSRTLMGEVILVPIRKNLADLESIYTLNEAGARIWELIDGRRKIKDIKKVIVQEYDVSPEKAEKDILNLLEQLKKIGAVHRPKEEQKNKSD